MNEWKKKLVKYKHKPGNAMISISKSKSSTTTGCDIFLEDNIHIYIHDMQYMHQTLPCVCILCGDDEKTFWWCDMYIFLYFMPEYIYVIYSDMKGFFDMNICMFVFNNAILSDMKGIYVYEL